jgi:hypothetical protein
VGTLDHEVIESTGPGAVEGLDAQVVDRATPMSALTSVSDLPSRWADLRRLCSRSVRSIGTPMRCYRRGARARWQKHLADTDGTAGEHVLGGLDEAQGDELAPDCGVAGDLGAPDSVLEHYGEIETPGSGTHLRRVGIAAQGEDEPWPPRCISAPSC